MCMDRAGVIHASTVVPSTLLECGGGIDHKLHRLQDNFCSKGTTPSLITDNYIVPWHIKAKLNCLNCVSVDE